jgi:hypothetical protein
VISRVNFSAESWGMSGNCANAFTSRTCSAKIFGIVDKAIMLIPIKMGFITKTHRILGDITRCEIIFFDIHN